MRKPNIVLIMTDQQRGDGLGIEGHPDLFTPHLDGVAHRGVRFTQAYTPCPICSAARRSIMTGHSPATDGAISNAPVPITLCPQDTLPNLFRRDGYQTFSIGRNMHQYPVHRRYGFEICEHNPFQDTYSTAHRDLPAILRNGAHPPGQVQPDFGIHYPHLMEHGISTNGHTSRTWPYDEQYHETVFAVNKAIEWIDRRDKDNPFFLYCGVTAPHPPLVPPAFYFERYRRRALRTPLAPSDWTARVIAGRCVYGDGVDGGMPAHPDYVQDTLAAYYGSINHVDDHLGRLFRRVRQEKEPTLVLFTSDHGEMLGDYGLWSKCRPYQGSVRIPFLLFSIGTDDLNRNLVVDVPVSLLDVLPTLADLCGIPVPEHVEGRTLSPLLSAPRGTIDRAFVHSEMCAYYEHAGFHMLTDGKLKYVWFSGAGDELLFDLRADPREEKDLSLLPASRPRLDRFRAELVRLLAGRPEGFSDGTRLVAGRSHGPTVPRAETEPSASAP